MLGTLRKGLLLTTASISAVVCVLCVGVLGYLHHQQLQHQLTARVVDASHALASNLSTALQGESDAWMTPFNPAQGGFEGALNVHVYGYQAQGNLEFVTSYNRPGTPPVASRLERLTASAIDSEAAAQSVDGVAITRQGIDYIAVIPAPQTDANANPQETPLGYLFVRADPSPLLQATRYIAFAIIVAVALAIVLSVFLATLLSRFFTRPLMALNSAAAEIARTRNYSQRLPRQRFHELDMLAYNFNTVLERVEQYISQRQRAELATNELNRELEQQVQDRTNALRNANQELLETLEQLHRHQGRQVEAQKMSSLSELVAGISHEINTPLGMAVTAASMLDDSLGERSDIAAANEQLAIVQRNLTRAVELINNFRKMAIEHTAEETVAIDFAELLEDIAASAKVYVDNAAGVQIGVTCDLERPVLAKVGVWQQLITSLIENSVTHGFTPAHETPSISIDVNVVTGDSVRIQYQDNGAGVAPDILRRIFDPFVTTKRGQGNSGLGMHLVYNLVTHTLDGSIHCDSELDNGFSVTIECPFSYADPDAPTLSSNTK